MLVYAIAVVVALAIPLVTRGSYTRLLDVQLALRTRCCSPASRSRSSLEYVTIPREHWHDVGFGLLVASYVLILAFVARNLVLRGMGIVFIGIACNALVITLNQGMPVKFPADWQNKSWAQATVKHHPQQPDDKLRFLSDIIVLKGPFESVSASATSSWPSACATSPTTRAASRSDGAPARGIDRSSADAGRVGAARDADRPDRRTRRIPEQSDRAPADPRRSG